MLVEGQKSRLQASYEAVYTPANGADPAHRIAQALEYIAAQMGQMNVKLDKIIAGPEKPEAPKGPRSEPSIRRVGD